MAKYTITLDSLVRQGYNVFEDDWQTFIPEHKPELCDKILQHYRFYEIGAETPARFRHYLNTQIRENLPRYNMLYESALWDLAPLFNRWVENGTEATTADRETAALYSNKARNALKRMAQSLMEQGDTTRKEDTGTTASGDKNWTENDVIDRAENENINVVGTQHRTEAEDTTRDRTEGLTGHDDETTDDVWKKTGHSTKDQDTRGTTSGTHTQWSSDTPQGKVVNGALNIDSTYLTNYQHSSDNQTTTGRLDETVDTVEDFTDKITRAFDTTRDTTEKETTDRDLTGETNSTTDTTRTLSGKDTIDKQGEEHWGEKGNTDFTSTVGETRRKFEDGTTDDSGTESTVSGSEQNKVSTQESTTVTKGNFDVSRAQLVQQYRAAFINVDLLIIEELANNFMGVF